MEAYPRGLERLVWSILLGGLALALGCICVGLVWEWTSLGSPSITPPFSATNLAGYLLVAATETPDMGTIPAVLVYTGIGILLLTPLASILASLLFFSLADRNWKFTAVTGFTLIVLVYVLFIR
jgi:uncharacterized membrane protein